MLTSSILENNYDILILLFCPTASHFGILAFLLNLDLVPVFHEPASPSSLPANRLATDRLHAASHAASHDKSIILVVLYQPNLPSQ